MSEQITGKIIQALPRKSGISKAGKSWEVAEYVIETGGEYPKKVVVTVKGRDNIESMHLNIGDEVTAFIDIDAHEYGGRWFNSVTAWRVDHIE